MQLYILQDNVTADQTFHQSSELYVVALWVHWVDSTDLVQAETTVNALVSQRQLQLANFFCAVAMILSTTLCLNSIGVVG